MSKLLSLRLTMLMLLFTSGLHAEGVEFILQVKFYYQDTLRMGYIRADHCPAGFEEEFVHDDEAFATEFNRRYGEMDEVVVYTRMLDQNELAARANFFMRPFKLDEAATDTLDVAQVTAPTLEKLWTKGSYHVEVLTELELADTSWLAGEKTTTYPLGDEVGCRLHLHHFAKGEEVGALVEELKSMYDPQSVKGQRERFLSLIARLKRRRVVVVELCGC